RDRRARAPPKDLTPGILSPEKGREVSFPNERQGSSGPRGRRRGARALEEGRREGVREDAALEVRLDDRLRCAGRAAGRARYAAGLRLRAGPRLAGGVSLHPRRPGDRISRKALDDAAVRGLRDREADEPALPLPARPRPDRAVDGVPPADALRVRLGPR